MFVILFSYCEVFARHDYLLKLKLVFKKIVANIYESEMRSILSALPSGVVIFELDGEVEFKFANDEFEELLKRVKCKVDNFVSKKVI